MDLRFSFQISGIRILIEADEQVLLGTVKAFFAGYNASQSGNEPHDINIKLYTSHKIPLKPDASTTLLFTYGRIKGYILDDDTLLLSDDNTFMIVHAKEGKSIAFVDSATLKRGTEFVSIFLTIALIELLRHHKLYYLHAGAVTDGRHSILVCGMGMSGKTTLTLGLAFNGWKMCADDAVLMKQGKNRISAIGFKKDIHVTGNTIRHFSHLLKDVRLPRPPFKKSSIPYGNFKTIDSITPDIILFVERTGTKKTITEPIGETQAMSMLLPQSLMVFFNKIHADRHMHALKILLHQTKAYRCFCGRDLLKNPLIVLDGIKE